MAMRRGIGGGQSEPSGAIVRTGRPVTSAISSKWRSWQLRELSGGSTEEIHERALADDGGGRAPRTCASRPAPGATLAPRSDSGEVSELAPALLELVSVLGLPKTLHLNSVTGRDVACLQNLAERAAGAARFRAWLSSSRSTAARRSAAPSGSSTSRGASSQAAEAGNEVCVVVSAMGDTTDELLELAAAGLDAARTTASSTCCSRRASASRWRCSRWRSSTSAARRSRSPARRRASSPTRATARRGSSTCARGACARRSRPARSRSSPASRASPRTTR